MTHDDRADALPFPRTEPETEPEHDPMNPTKTNKAQATEATEATEATRADAEASRASADHTPLPPEAPEELICVSLLVSHTITTENGVPTFKNQLPITASALSRWFAKHFSGDMEACARRLKTTPELTRTEDLLSLRRALTDWIGSETKAKRRSPFALVPDEGLSHFFPVRSGGADPARPAAHFRPFTHRRTSAHYGRLRAVEVSFVRTEEFLRTRWEGDAPKALLCAPTVTGETFMTPLPHVSAHEAEGDPEEHGRAFRKEVIWSKDAVAVMHRFYLRADPWLRDLVRDCPEAALGFVALMLKNARARSLFDRVPVRQPLLVDGAGPSAPSGCRTDAVGAVLLRDVNLLRLHEKILLRRHRHPGNEAHVLEHLAGRHAYGPAAGHPRCYGLLAAGEVLIVEYPEKATVERAAGTPGATALLGRREAERCLKAARKAEKKAEMKAEGKAGTDGAEPQKGTHPACRYRFRPLRPETTTEDASGGSSGGSSERSSKGSSALRTALAAITAAATVGLTGCMNLTGLAGASDEFSCPGVVNGTPCTSMQLVHAKSVAGNVPVSAEELQAAKAAAMVPAKKAGTAQLSTADFEGTAVLGGAGSGSAGLGRGSENGAAFPTSDALSVEPGTAETAGMTGVPGVAGVGTAARTRPAPHELAATANRPARVPEKLLAVWIAPYQDQDGDLHEGHMIWVTVERARWRTVDAKKGRGAAWAQSVPIGAAGAAHAARAASTSGAMHGDADTAGTATTGSTGSGAMKMRADAAAMADLIRDMQAQRESAEREAAERAAREAAEREAEAAEGAGGVEGALGSAGAADMKGDDHADR